MTGFATLNAVPERATSGDKIPLALSGLTTLYPVSDYALQVFIKAGAAPAVTLTLSGATGTHAGILDFSSVPAGTHAYTIKACRLSDSAFQTVESGLIVVAPDAAAQDTRSHAVKTLEAIESLIEGRATKDVNSYTIAGRSLTRMSADELVKWRSYYRNEVAMERRAGRPNGGRRITLAGFK